MPVNLFTPSHVVIRLFRKVCWTYSHHCQIANKNPSKRWNGEFWGFRIGIIFVQRDYVLWVFVCSVSFSLFSGYHAEGYHAPTIPYGHHAEGYHARADTFNLTRYRVCRVTTPSYHATYKLLGTGGLSHLRVVFSYFSFHRLIRQCFHNNNHNFSTEPGAHRTDLLNTRNVGGAGGLPVD